MDTAREWYHEARQARAEGSDLPETAIASGGTPEIADLSRRAHRTADQAGSAADELAEGATPGSVRDDNVVRRVRDVEVLSRQEGIELASAPPRLRPIDRLIRAVASGIPYIEAALRVVEAGADFARISWERFGNIATRQVSVILEQICGWFAPNFGFNARGFRVARTHS